MSRAAGHRATPRPVVTRLLEDRPETVWALLADGAATPGWLAGSATTATPVAGTPPWPGPGSQVTHRTGRRGGRAVTTVVVACDPGRRLALSVSRTGGVPTPGGSAGATLVTLDVEPAPVFRTALRVATARGGLARLVARPARVLGDRAARRVVVDLVVTLRRRGPVMALPGDRTAALRLTIPHTDVTSGDALATSQ